MTTILTTAHRILNAPRGSVPLCTWVGSVADQRAAAQAALDGETDELEMMLDMDAAELWLRGDAEEWMANWQPTSVAGMAA